MLEIISERHREYRTDAEILFYRDRDGGFAFPAGPDHKPLPFASDAAKSNYEYCMAHPEKFPYHFNHYHEYTYSFIEPAVARCECGEEFPLINEYMGACECPKCGRWYQITSGQELLHPSKWDMGDEEEW